MRDYNEQMRGLPEEIQERIYRIVHRNGYEKVMKEMEKNHKDDVKIRKHQAKYVEIYKRINKKNMEWKDIIEKIKEIKRGLKEFEYEIMGGYIIRMGYSMRTCIFRSVYSRYDIADYEKDKITTVEDNIPYGSRLTNTMDL